MIPIGPLIYPALVAAIVRTVGEVGTRLSPITIHNSPTPTGGQITTMELTLLPRDKVLQTLGISNGELGRLLREKRVPMPVRIEGEILWYKDEVEASKERVQQITSRRKK